MTSLREWVDSLSDDTRNFLLAHYNWIDMDTEDYYKCIKIDSAYFNSTMENADRSYRGDAFWKSLVLGLLIKVREKDPTVLKSFIDEKTMMSLIKKTSEGADKLFLFSPFLQKEIMKEKLKDNNELSLSDLLYITDDYSNIDYKRLDYHNLRYSPILKEILGVEACADIARSNIDFIKVTTDRLSLNDEVIDTLFFGNNQLSKDEKLQVIRHIYNPSMYDIEDYMKRFVTVDESYLKYIYNIIDQDPAIAAKLYKLKKPDYELTGNETTEMKYRYPKKYRKLFQMAACCSRKNVGKAMAGTIGELASMLKMYNWDFYTLFDCMYPNSVENESEENEEEVVA